MNVRLDAIVERLGGELQGDPAIEVSGIASLDNAGSSHITFLSNSQLLKMAVCTQAAAIILSPGDANQLQDLYSGARILTPNPYLYFAKLAQFFCQAQAEPIIPGIHSSAVIGPGARISPTAQIGPHVTIEAGAIVDDNVVIDAGCFIGRFAKIGAGTRFFSNVTFHAACEIGQRGLVQSGAVVGADGFGFANDEGAWIKIPQTGRVIVGDDVEIGANTTIDRGTLADTVIENGVKLDNQIQIGHNCRIGAHTAMAGCVGIAGSTKIGKYCTLGGAAMVIGHLTIADRVHISAGTLVSRSIAEPGQYTGVYPLAKHREWEKSAAIVRNLSKMREKIRLVEKTIATFLSKS